MTVPGMVGVVAMILQAATGPGGRIAHSVLAAAGLHVEAQELAALLARPHVMVPPWGTNSIGICWVEDPESEKTRPVGGPLAADIFGTLNSVYAQACVQFVMGTDSLTNIAHDTGGPIWPLFWRWFIYRRNGAMEYCEEPVDWLKDNLKWAGNLCVFLFKKRGNDLERETAGYVRPDLRTHAIVFTETVAPNYTPFVIAHEVGHLLWISVRNDDQHGHDLGHERGNVPVGTGVLMRPIINWPTPQPRWIRHHDWEVANTIAKGRAGTQ